MTSEKTQLEDIIEGWGWQFSEEYPIQSVKITEGILSEEEIVKAFLKGIGVKEIVPFETMLRDENWCKIDMLSGEPLKHGELIEIKWPGGQTTKHKISLQKRRENAGHNETIEISIAYADLPISNTNTTAKVELYTVNGLLMRRCNNE